MDPYKYLLKKLKIRAVIPPGYEFLLQLTVNNQFVNFYPSKGSAKDIFSELHVLGEMCKIDYLDPSIKPIIETIRCFPEILESQEHVDILLALNGLTGD